MGKNKTEKNKSKPLNPKWELFCRLYTLTNEFFGNGTLSYAEAFDYHLETLSKKTKYAGTDIPEEGIKAGDVVELSEYQKAFNTCSVQANRLLRNGKVQARCTQLMNSWMKDENVDAELAMVIKQKDDLPSKVAAIREFNKLKGRITEKVKVNLGLSLVDVLDETDKEQK